MVWNLPNILTLFRLLLVGVFIALFSTGHPMLALLAFLVAGATDLADGYIARKHDQVTDWGKVMDPLADKLMQVAVWVCLLWGGFVEGWLVIVMAVKEGMMILGGALGYKWRKLLQPSRAFGKFAAAFMFGALVASFFHNYIQPYDFYVRLAAVILNIIAFIGYAITFLKMWRNSLLTKDKTTL